MIFYVDFCSCVPLYHFDYIYTYLMHTNISYVDWYVNYQAKLYSRVFIELIVLLSGFCYQSDVLCSKLYLFLLALRILVLTGMGGTLSACYLKLRPKTLERVHRYILAEAMLEIEFSILNRNFTYYTHNANFEQCLHPILISL